MICIIVKKYRFDSNSKYLTNDLVDELRGKGVVVNVVALGDVDYSGVVEKEHGSEFYFPFGAGGKYLKYFFLWYRLGVWYIKIRNKKDFFRNLVNVAPLTPFAPFYIFSTIFCEKSVCIVFDLFPFHQVQIGLIPRTLARPLSFLEGFLLRMQTCVSGMTPQCQKEISRRYKIPMRSTIQLPPWGASPALSAKESCADIDVVPCSIKAESRQIKIVFGGQIVRGRRVDLAIDFFQELISEFNLNIQFDIYSEGERYENLKREYSRDWIDYCDPVSRSEYLQKLKGYDFGLAVTDSRVSLPTFPSKIVDYAACNLRSICFVESVSDIDSVLECGHSIHLNKFDTSPAAKIEAYEFISSDISCHALNELADIRIQLSAEVAANRILKEFSSDT